MKPLSHLRRFRLSGISLKTQLMLSFVAVTFTVLLISSYYSYQKTLDIQKSRTRDTTMAQFRQIETNIRTLMHEVDKYSKTFLYESDVQTFLQSEKLPNADFIPLQQDVTKLIARYFGNYDYLDSIYLFSDNGMVIGGTQSQNQSSVLLGREYPFYSHPLYLSLKSGVDNLLQWSGGLTSKDFMRTPPALPGSNKRVISALMRITSLDERQLSTVLPVNAVLAVNIKERYLNSFYDNLRSGENGSISIIDGKGTVISSTAEASVGETYTFIRQIPEGSPFGSFAAHRDNGKAQVLYYRMSDSSWTLIDEVPSELYTKETVAIRNFTAAVFVLSLVLIGALSSFWMYRIMGSLQELIRGMRNVGRGNLGLTLSGASSKEIGQLTEQFNRMSTGILDLMKRNEEAEKEKRRLEIEALQSQINPHFLFNTLTTVKWMAAVAGATNIKECITNLGNMLRPIYYHPSLLWSIEEEIGFVKNYMNIMNFRYGEELEFVYDVPPSLLTCQTLRFIIQPSIENAIMHGKTSKGVIRVSVAETGGDLVLVVQDTRGGMSQSRADELNQCIQGDAGESKGIGLSNVNKRIRLHFGEQYGLAVESEEGVGTKVLMKIPKIEDGQKVQNS